MIAPNRRVARENARFRADCLQVLPLYATRALVRAAANLEKDEGHIATNLFIGEQSGILKKAKTHIAFDNAEIDWCANRAVEISRQLAYDYPALCDFIKLQGFEVPTGTNITKSGVRARTQLMRWWRRLYEKQYTRTGENAIRAIGQIHKHASPYVSSDGYSRYKDRQRINREYLQRRMLIDQQTGECFNLWDISQMTVSNPRIRRTELMTRIAGLERRAIELGYTWIHMTLTAPSLFHAYKADGTLNKLWIGNTTGHGGVRDAHDWLNRQWARSRAKLNRTGITYCGLRCVEPHHDGTPHWHVLIFGSPSTLEKVESVLRSYWMQEHSGERGALTHRVSVIKGDTRAGSAAGYMAKYISKNTDGQALDSDDASETDLSGLTACQLVTAWSRIHGIRQFQEFGSGNHITLWRELRRIKKDTDIPPIEAVRQTVNKPADYAEFMKQCELNPSVQIDKREPRETDSSGRVKIRLNRYGEMPTVQVCGVSCLHLGRVKRIATRGAWLLLIRPSLSCSALLSALGPVEITVRGAGGYNEPSTWSNPRETGTYGPRDISA